MKARLFNRLWLWSQARPYRQFSQQLAHSARVQDELLKAYLRHNAPTQYGRLYAFAKLGSYQAYADAVPLVNHFDQLQPYIDRMAAGQPDVLFPGATSFFESTSGSTSRAKWIPYNARLKAEFQTAVAVWMNDLYRHVPAAFSGPSYWSLSPALKPQAFSAVGIPVGISSDTDYFNPLVAYMLRHIFATPPGLSHIKDAHLFYVHTWRHLLACRHLSFVSVWSPNFLLNLDAFLRSHLTQILDTPLLQASRKQEVARLVANGATWAQLFPALALVSCWTQAQAAIWLPAVSDVLGGVPIQGKGLLSTEGVVTIPYRGFQEHLLAFTAQFYEFRCPNTQRLYRSHELEPGQRYEVVITTSGGLYRYCTGDLVQCTGYRYQTPSLHFMGRGAGVSDLVGEKLSEVAINSIFAQLVHHYPIDALYLYPRRQQNQVQYLLLIEHTRALDTERLVGQLEEALCQNPYYQQARAVGQLGPVQALKVAPGFSTQLYQHYKKSRGIKDGDVKLPLLLPMHFLEPILGY